MSIQSFAWTIRSDSTIYVGAWGGASYARIMGYPNAPLPLIGNSFGLIFAYHANQEITLKSGISFIQKGFISSNEYFDVYNTTIGLYPTTYKFKYLNIPIVASYNLGRRKFNVYLSAGFDIDFLLEQNTYAELPLETDAGVAIDPFNIINTVSYKKINFGINVGGGMEYKIKPNIIVFLDVKYMYGLNNILNVNSDYNLKQRPIVANLGIRFGIPIKSSDSEEY